MMRAGSSGPGRGRVVGHRSCRSIRLNESARFRTRPPSRPSAARLRIPNDSIQSIEIQEDRPPARFFTGFKSWTIGELPVTDQRRGGGGARDGCPRIGRCTELLPPPLGGSQIDHVPQSSDIRVWSCRGDRALVRSCLSSYSLVRRQMGGPAMSQTTSLLLKPRTER